MGLLDGDIAALFGSVFGGLYLDGTLTKVTLVDDGVGGYTTTTATHAIKGQTDSLDEEMIAAAGVASNAVKLIVLQSGVPVTLTTDDRVTLGGKEWLISGPVNQDPARSHWVAMGIERRV